MNIGFMGTPIYCSPELWNQEYNEQIDSWSLGVLLYYILLEDLEQSEPSFHHFLQDQLSLRLPLNGKLSSLICYNCSIKSQNSQV